MFNAIFELKFSSSERRKKTISLHLFTQLSRSRNQKAVSTKARIKTVYKVWSWADRAISGESLSAKSYQHCDQKSIL